jgi:uncharacterized protein YndB with AHSA1/START domain
MIEGDEVIHELRLPVAPDEAFEMFVDPARLVRWIGISAELQPRPGGRFRFEVMPGQFCEGLYEIVDRPHRLVFTWGWTAETMGVPPGSSQVEVTFTATAAGDSTTLRLVHRALGPDARQLHDDGWTRFLARLMAVATNRAPGPYPTETPEERARWLSMS